MAAPSFHCGFTSAAASGLPQHSEDSPLPFRSASNDGLGVFCTGPNQFEVQVMIGGTLTRLSGFTSESRATDAYRRMQEGLSRPVAGAPALSRAPVPAESTPEPAHAPEEAPGKYYKGVWNRQDGLFQAVIYPGGRQSPVRLGTFDTAEEAADVYDNAVRRCGGQIVNTPRFPGEIQATPRGKPTWLKDPAPAPAPAPASPEAAPELGRTAKTAQAKVYKGVYAKPNGTFVAALSIRSKQIYVGTYGSASSAAAAYDDALRRAGGKAVNTPRYPGETRAVPGKRRGAASAPVLVRLTQDDKPSNVKRGRSPSEGGAAASPAAATDAAAAVTPAELAAAAAAQFRGVTAVPGGSGFFAWLSYCNTDGGMMRRMLGAFGTAEEAARAVDAAARRHSQLEQLNFPTAEECARMGRQPRSAPHQQAGRQAERKLPESDEDEEEDDDDDWLPRGTPRRRVESPVPTRRDTRRDANAVAPAASLPMKVPQAHTPVPSPVTPAPVALVARKAPEAAALPAPAPSPSPLQLQIQQLPQPNDDVIAFLRSISPPLRCLDAAVAAVPSSGVSMHRLRQLSRMLHSTMVAACVDRVAAALCIDDPGDKLDLMLALDRLNGP